MAKFQFDWDGLKEKIEKDDQKKKSFEKDTRFWNPDKKAAGTYIIRFLPDMDGNPFVKITSHSFSYMVDGAKKWWIRNCINTFGYDRECPICKKNMEYYNSAFSSDKEIAKARKRKTEYISNILVIKDPKNPDNDGKVMLYKYGQKIYDKIKAHMFPSEQDLEDPDFKTFVPFDLYEGADFKLKVAIQGEFPNYADSSFSSQKPLGDDKKIEKIMKETNLLSEFIAEDQFPTNKEVIEKLGDLLGLSEQKSNTVEKKQEDDIQDLDNIDDIVNSDDSIPFDVETSTSDDIDDDAAFFDSLN